MGVAGKSFLVIVMLDIYVFRWKNFVILQFKANLLSFDVTAVVVKLPLILSFISLILPLSWFN